MLGAQKKDRPRRAVYKERVDAWDLTPYHDYYDIKTSNFSDKKRAPRRAPEVVPP